MKKSQVMPIGFDLHRTFPGFGGSPTGPRHLDGVGDAAGADASAPPRGAARRELHQKRGAKGRGEEIGDGKDGTKLQTFLNRQTED